MIGIILFYPTVVDNSRMGRAVQLRENVGLIIIKVIETPRNQNIL